MAVTNTGIVERTIVGVNESDLFLDSEATSVTTNTGIVERSIVGVNESDLFLDSEATSVTTNTGIVERSIVGVHDANFVRPLGDEEITNGGFDANLDSWETSFWWVWNSLGAYHPSTSTHKPLYQKSCVIGKTYLIKFDLNCVGISQAKFSLGSNTGSTTQVIGTQLTTGSYSYVVTATAEYIVFNRHSTAEFYVDNISVKEMLVNRESTTTNTGIVERPITGVNASDALFPDNTESTVVNISDTIIPLLTALEARATTFENREGTQNILINIQKC